MTPGTPPQHLRPTPTTLSPTTTPRPVQEDVPMMRRHLERISRPLRHPQQVEDLERRLVLVGWARRHPNSRAMRRRHSVVCLRRLGGEPVSTMRVLGMKKVRLVREVVEKGLYFFWVCEAFDGVLRREQSNH